MRGGAGSLDRRITIQARTDTQDGAGQAVATWADAATVWARWEPFQVREPFTDQQFAAFIDSRFIIRRRPSLIPSPKTHRVSYDGKTYDIAGVREIGRREALELLCYARAEA